MKQESNSKLAYLSGAIEHSPDGGLGWRNDMTKLIKERLGHRVFHPNEELGSILAPDEIRVFRKYKLEEPDKFREMMRRIIDYDLRVLEKETDYVICYWDEYAARGGGTQGEVSLAYRLGKPVYLVTKMPRNRLSSWILGCSEKIFLDPESLVRYLELRNSGG